MRERDFELWMTRHYLTTLGRALDPRSRGSTLSNCRRVERHEGDLDGHAAKDRCRGVLARLVEGNTRIPIKGEAAPVLNSLRSAVRLYAEFSAEWPAGALAPKDRSGGPSRADVAAAQPQGEGPRATPARWPAWEGPSEDQILRLARELTPLIRFLHPDIVAAVVADNEKHRTAWAEALTRRGVDVARYLWVRSACAFPGVRRHAGSEEVARHRGHVAGGAGAVEQALATDDNTYPKHLWSFVFRGKPFQNFGPQGYALAHLIDHKDYKSRYRDELDGADLLADRTPFGLYTCASNAVFVPTAFLRPTDHTLFLRGLLQRRALELYGKACTLVPPPASIRAAPSAAWACAGFRWAEPVGEPKTVESFLAFRARQMNKLLAGGAAWLSGANPEAPGGNV